MQGNRDAAAVPDQIMMKELKQEMTVSAIIVVKNGEAYLAEAIESILKQSLPPNEILVIDGKSTDESAKIAKSYPKVTLIEQMGSGLADARNFGIEQASGELIAFLDSDDYWHPEKLQTQVARFSDSPEIQYSFSNVKLFLEPGCELRKGYDWYFLNEEQIGRTPGTLVVRKSLFDQVGKFDPMYKIACDVEWFTRVKDYQIKSVFVSQILLYKRLHYLNLSGNVDINRREILDVIRKSVERKKKPENVVR